MIAFDVRTTRGTAAFGWAAGVASAIWFAALASGREFGTYARETDFYWTFVPEAERLLSGEALALQYHPPLYALVLAAVRLLAPDSDWLALGLAVSVVSAALVLPAAVSVFSRLTGPMGGVGAAVGLLGSATLPLIAASASSDALFLLLTFAAVLAALRGLEQPTRTRLIVAGALAGAVAITRSNGFTWLLLVSIPLAGDVPPRVCLRRVVVTAAAAALPFAWLGLYQGARGGPLWSAGSAHNLALTYVAPEHVQGGMERLDWAKAHFHGVWDVLTYAPLRIAVQYAHHLVEATWMVVHEPLWPLGWVALPGFVLLARSEPRRPRLLLLAAFAAQLLVVSVMAYQARFFLYLLPLLGASAFVAVQWVFARLRSSSARLALVVVLVGWLAVGCYRHTRAAHVALHEQDVELQAVSLHLSEAGEAPAVIVARKPHLAARLGARWFNPPFRRGDTLEDALAPLRGIRGSVLVYVGSTERALWPEGVVASMSHHRGLVQMAAGPQAGGWRVFRVSRP
jgi:hypothetical protein